MKKMGSFAHLIYVIYLSAQNFLKKFYDIKCTKIEQMETMKENQTLEMVKKAKVKENN